MYLTPREVAERLRVSAQTVYRLVESGELHSKRIGRSIRIHQRAVDDFLAGANVFDPEGEL